MSIAFTNIAILICTASMLCIAMTLSWLYFGRRRHVLLWAIASGGAVLQWALTALATTQPEDDVVLLSLRGTLVVIDATLAALASRDRSGLPMRLPLFIVGGVIAIAALIVVLAGYQNLALRGFIANAYCAIMMVIAAGAIFPRDRVITAPEIVAFATFMIFGMLTMALGLLSLGMGPSGTADGATTYRMVLVVALPPTYSALGIAIVFLLASDLNERLKALVTRDPLTGVLNRRGLAQAAIASLAGARRHGRPLSFVVCDIDNFKAFNFERGYPLGDRVLAAFADLILSNVREEDCLGRVDGDSFGLILIDAKAAKAVEAAERARIEFAALAFDGERPLCLTASFGISEIRNEDIDMRDAGMRADQALQNARAAGRNCAMVA